MRILVDEISHMAARSRKETENSSTNLVAKVIDRFGLYGTAHQLFERQVRSTLTIISEPGGTFLPAMDTKGSREVL